MHSIILTLQVDKFEPAQLADVLSAYANMVHHPGALIEPLNEKLLPKLDSMDAGELQNTCSDAAVHVHHTPSQHSCKQCQSLKLCSSALLAIH